jgi:hypothetical protein
MYTCSMYETGPFAPLTTGGQPVGNPIAPATKERPRPSRSGGWCTTLQQPAAMGVLGFILAYFHRRQRR